MRQPHALPREGGLSPQPPHRECVEPAVDTVESVGRTAITTERVLIFQSLVPINRGILHRGWIYSDLPLRAPSFSCARVAAQSRSWCDTRKLNMALPGKETEYTVNSGRVASACGFGASGRVMANPSSDEDVFLPLRLALNNGGSFPIWRTQRFECGQVLGSSPIQLSIL